MHTLRSTLPSGITIEFLVPPHKTERLLVLCDGMPAMPSKRRVMDYYVKKGYAVVHMRYRGTWESSGEFLAKSPHEDILLLLKELQEPILDAWGSIAYELPTKHVVLMGSSFAGPAMLLVSSDNRVKKIVAFSPVVDWLAPSEDEPFDHLVSFVTKGFNQAYRCPKENWQKLQDGTFYNPVAHRDTIQGNKIFIVHASDDTVVSARSVKDFALQTGSKLIMKKKGGHFGASSVLKWSNRFRVNNFLT